jgi:transposase
VSWRLPPDGVTLRRRTGRSFSVVGSAYTAVRRRQDSTAAVELEFQYETQPLPLRPEPHSGEPIPASAATGPARRTAPPGQPPRGPPRHPLPRVGRLLLADEAQGPAPGSTCSDSFRKGRHDGTWQTINDPVRTQVRHRHRRNKSPSMTRLNGQSVTTTEQGGPRGKDTHQKVNGRKRQRVVETLGLVVAAVVHAADLPDRDGVKLVLEKLVGRVPRRKKILAEGTYHGGSRSGPRKSAVGFWSWSSAPRGRRSSRFGRGAGSWSGPSPGWGVTTG